MAHINTTPKSNASPKSIQVSLLAKVLEQENPIITSKMLPFLMQDGVAEVLVNFITRIDQSLLPHATSPEDQAKKVKRAHTAVSLFEKSSPPIIAFLEKRADDVAASLFDALHHLTPAGGSSGANEAQAKPTTQGQVAKPAAQTPKLEMNENILDLWKRTWLAVLTISPVQAIEGATSDHEHMTGAIPAMKNDDVAYCVLQLYATAASQPALGRKLTWFTWQLSRQIFSDNPLACSACGEMLLSLIYTYSAALQSAEVPVAPSQPVPSVHAFLQPFQSTEFLENMSKGVGKGGVVGTLCADILWKLTELEGSYPSKMCSSASVLVQSIAQLENKAFMNEEKTETTAPTTTTAPPEAAQPNKNSKKTKAAKPLKSSTQVDKPNSISLSSSTSSPILSIANLFTPPSSRRAAAEQKAAEKLRGLSLSSGNISTNNAPIVQRDKMSVARCGLVRILAATADIKVNGTLVTLDSLAADPHAWRVMAAWFLRFPYANIYHQQFYTLIKTAITNRHWPSLKKIFVENKFLGTIVTHYHSSTRSGVKGYIKLICTDLLELFTDTNAATQAAAATTTNTSPADYKKTHKKSNSQTPPPSIAFIGFLEAHTEWRAMEPELKTEITWSSPVPERPPMGMMGGRGGGGGGITGFERDTMEEVLLDMPTNKFKRAAEI